MTKTRAITYWVVTGVLAAGLLGSGIQQLTGLEAPGAMAPAYAWGMAELGFPPYLLTILGVWKILGAIVLLIPGLPVIKEWAYAGCLFLLTGAMYSHFATGGEWYDYLPALFLLMLGVLSWTLRPQGRRVTALPWAGTTSFTRGASAATAQEDERAFPARA